MLRVRDEDLEIMTYPTALWGGCRWAYNGVPFTGISFEYHKNTQILLNESQYIDGYIEGLQIEYHSNGQKSNEYYSKHGHVRQYMKKWDEQGKLIYHVEYDDNGNTTNAILY